jgi:hypothetical protein
MITYCLLEEFMKIHKNYVNYFIVFLFVMFFTMQMYHYWGNPVNHYLINLGYSRSFANGIIHSAIFFVGFFILSKAFEPTYKYTILWVVLASSILGVFDELFDIIKGYKPSMSDFLYDIAGAITGYIVYFSIVKIIKKMQ